MGDSTLTSRQGDGRDRGMKRISWRRSDMFGAQPAKRSVTFALIALLGSVIVTTPGAAGQTGLVCAGQAVTVDLNKGQLPTNGPDVVWGTPGDDKIALGGGDDVACMGEGNDTVFGQGGNDRIYGQGGDDKLRGGVGDDTLDGGGGADDINGGKGNDTIRGGAGDDIALRGGVDDDTLYGGPGNDRLINGNGGVDIVNGDDGNDTLFGGPRGDTIRGGEGDDLIRGYGGLDKIYGEGGNDEIYGNSEADYIEGNSGTDVCNGGTNATAPDESWYCETNSNMEIIDGVPQVTPTPTPSPTPTPTPVGPTPVPTLTPEPTPSPNTNNVSVNIYNKWSPNVVTAGTPLGGWETFKDQSGKLSVTLPKTQFIWIYGDGDSGRPRIEGSNLTVDNWPRFFASVLAENNLPETEVKPLLVESYATFSLDGCSPLTKEVSLGISGLEDVAFADNITVNGKKGLYVIFEGCNNGGETWGSFAAVFPDETGLITVNATFRNKEELRVVDRVLQSYNIQW